MKKVMVAVAFVAWSAVSASAQSAKAPIDMVAAENFYGDVAKQIGGADVNVTSILSNPDEDPHLFEVSPAVGRAVSAARIVVYSGIDYDPWMKTLLAAARSTHRKTIVVADLVGKKEGDNPHIWYDVKTMRAYAHAVADALSAEDPLHKADYERGEAKFDASLDPIQAKIAELRQRLAGVPATATEPIFGYMFEALDMKVKNQSFQLSIMNNTEPSAADIAAFEDDLRNRKVDLLIYNSQASDPVAERMEKLATSSHIPVVGATETEPPSKTYQDWMLSELTAVDRALPRRPSERD